MKVGIVLEGGAMRGMYTAGVLDVMMDYDLSVTDMLGVSAGVLFGVNYASKQKGRTLRYNKKYIKNDNYMSLKSLITTGNLINKDFAFYEIPYTLDIFDQEAFAASKINFYATVTNVENGKPEYIKVKNVFEQMEVLRASSALPFVSKMVEWKGKKYLDGGLSDSIPIKKMTELGCDKIIVILTRAIDYRKKPVKTATRILNAVAYSKYPKLVRAMNKRNANYNRRIEEILKLEKMGKIFVVRPSEPIEISRIEKDLDKLQAVYDLGVRDTQSIMKNMLEYINK